MLYPSKTIEIFPRDNDHCKRLKDPIETHLFHLEAFLPFSEAVKLDPGNANVRPFSEHKKPFRDMIDTVEKDPGSFHLKNRGITYLCEKFEYDNAKHILRLTVPNIPSPVFKPLSELERAFKPLLDPEQVPQDVENDEPKFGIADGGHTFEVIRQTVARANELLEQEGWKEPSVRVHFMAGDASELNLEQVVEALNTSSQVQQYTLDEYQNKFDELKDALVRSGFDTNLVGFRENEEKEWDIREVVQRMACFLKDRWKNTQPASMYRSKGKALDLYTNDATRGEFKKLFDVVRDVITFPEFIQSEFSQGASVKGKRFGALRAVKALKKSYTRPGTDYPTSHVMDLAASLPLAAAFRELLELKGDRYSWRVPPKEVFGKCAEDLYKALVTKSRTAKSVNSLGSDTEYWTQASNIVLRTKDEILASRNSG